MMPPTQLSESEIQHAVETEFRCERCGNCCKGEGMVKIGKTEAQRIAAHLNLEFDDFLKRFTKRAGPGKWWLLDQPGEEQWCTFLTRDEEGLFSCGIHEVKPDQCGHFPLQWRNEDSFQTCRGLSALVRRLAE